MNLCTTQGKYRVSVESKWLFGTGKVGGSPAMLFLRVASLVASAAAQSTLPGVTCSALGVDLRFVVGPPREQAICTAMTTQINNYCSGTAPNTLACRPDGADPAQYELYFTSAATCTAEAAALSVLARTAYGVSTTLTVTCGPNETAIIAGSSTLSTTDCSRLAGGIRFLGGGGTAALRTSVCNSAAGVITTTEAPVQSYTFYFDQTTAFDQMYSASSPPALPLFRQDLGIALATAITNRNSTLSFSAARIVVLTVSSSGRFIVAVDPPISAAGSSTASIVTELTEIIDNQFQFLFGGFTATSLPVQTTAAPLTSEDDGGNGAATTIYVVVAIAAVILIAVIVWTRRKGPTDSATLNSAMWYSQPTRKEAPRRLHYTKLREGPALSWTRDIGKYAELSGSEISRIFPSDRDYISPYYAKSFPLGDGNRSSRDYAVRVKNLSDTPSHQGALKEHHDVISENMRGASHYGLAYVDSFHKERAIALLSDLFSWDDVWDSGADIVVTMTAGDEDCGVHIPGEHHAAQHGPVVATRIGALKVSPSVAVTVISLYHEVTQQTRTVRIFRASSWGQPLRLSVFIELLIAAKETVRQYGSAESIVFLHDDSRQVGPPAGSLAVAWVCLQDALYTGGINVPQTLLIMQSTRPGLIAHGADYTIVYAALRHLLLAVPAIHEATATKVDSAMKEAMDNWLASADQARAFGEPEPIEFESTGPPNDGGYLTLQTVDVDDDDEVEQIGFGGSVGGSSVSGSESGESEGARSIAEFDGFEEGAELSHSEVPVDHPSHSDEDVAEHAPEVVESAEAELVEAASAIDDATAPPTLEVAEEVESEDETDFEKFRTKRASMKMESKLAKKRAEEEARRKEEEEKKAAAAAAIEEARIAREQKRLAEAEAERLRLKAEADAKLSETFGFFEQSAAEPEPAFVNFKKTKQQLEQEKAEAQKKEAEELKAAEEAERKRKEEEEEEAKRLKEEEELRIIEEEKAAKAAAVREAYRARRRGSARTFADGKKT